jgi:hypothetical protein
MKLNVMAQQKPVARIVALCLNGWPGSVKRRPSDAGSPADGDGELVFKTSGELTAEQKVAVSEIAEERGRDGVRTLKIRLYDKLAAMGHLAKLLNLLVDREEISGPNGGPVEVTDHRTRIMDRLNAIAKRQAPDNDGALGGYQKSPAEAGPVCGVQCSWAIELYRPSFPGDGGD